MATTTEQVFSSNAATIVATEHWSLLGTRAMVWNEAMSRAGMFLTVLSAAVVALALAADASDFGRPFRVFALVLLPAVLFLGIGTYARLVHINAEDSYIVQAMNRLRHAYLDMAPELAPYFTASPHDDEPGILHTINLCQPTSFPLWTSIFDDTPTVIATINALITAIITGLAANELGAPATLTITAGAIAFLAVWLTLFALQVHALATFRRTAFSRFPTPTDHSV